MSCCDDKHNDIGKISLEAISLSNNLLAILMLFSGLWIIRTAYRTSSAEIRRQRLIRQQAPLPSKSRAT